MLAVRPKYLKIFINFLSTDIKKASSIDISPADDTATVTIEKIKAGTPPFILYIIDSFHYFTSIRLNYNDTKMVLYKGWLINARAWKSLIRRYELVLGSCCLNVLLGCLFGWIMGPSGAVTDASKVVAYFALGAVLALFANLQYVFYIFGYHQASNYPCRCVEFCDICVSVSSVQYSAFITANGHFIYRCF